ncbi:hypothetical protein KC19_8G126900 [Ceratodon purpureus]|uniref:Uncharacterized protein n=1 Tax=Ceratodon purpureus TaxID=3225 RepID=A0A8T0H0I4_CERPU|nr:hypothetical protein KC19_8G126900 [Ceratodon purpureus]
MINHSEGSTVKIMFYWGYFVSSSRKTGQWMSSSSFHTDIFTNGFYVGLHEASLIVLIAWFFPSPSICSSQSASVLFVIIASVSSCCKKNDCSPSLAMLHICSTIIKRVAIQFKCTH